MNLIEAFNIQSEYRRMITFVGGGGKTSTMFRLAQELKSHCMKVMVTTTTAIYYPGKSLYDHIFLWDGIEALTAKKQDLEQGSITVIGSLVTDEGKLKGLQKEWVEELYGQGIFDMILVEGDGAREKPIKAPDVHEPVIPEHTSILAGLIGIDCYGKKINSKWVHRSQILMNMVGKTEEDVIDDAVIVKLALSSSGLFKDCPREAEKVLLINKVEDQEDFSIAERVGHAVLKQSPDIKKVLIGRIHGQVPIQSVMVMKREIG